MESAFKILNMNTINTQDETSEEFIVLCVLVKASLLDDVFHFYCLEH